MTTKNEVTNEDLMSVLQDLMQLTSDNFDKVKLDISGLKSRFVNVEYDTRELKTASFRHEKALNEIKEITQNSSAEVLGLRADIKEILDRLLSIENRLPTISEDEIRKLQAEMQFALNWIAKVSKANKIQLEFPKS